MTRDDGFEKEEKFEPIFFEYRKYRFSFLIGDVWIENA